MKAVILAAGMGRRMGAEVDIPKCLLMIGHKSILFRQIENLFSIGVRDITVVVGYKAEQVESEIAKNSECSSVKCLFNPLYAITENIVSLWVYLIHCYEKRETIILSGDRILRSDIFRGIRDSFGSTLVALGPKYCSVVPKDSVVVRENMVVEIGGESPCVSGGIIKISENDISHLLDSVQETLQEESGIQKWYIEAVGRMIKKGKRVKALIFPDNYCFNVNRPADLGSFRLEMSKEWIE